MPFKPGQSGNPATQFQPGQSGNPDGPKPGYKHLSTHIQDMLNDENFEGKYIEGYELKTYKGAPMAAIIRVAQLKAIAGDAKMMDLLFKYGYGTKTEVEHSGGVAVEGSADKDIKEQFSAFLKNQTKSETPSPQQ
jgi:hypothetical protein